LFVLPTLLWLMYTNTRQISTFPADDSSTHSLRHFGRLWLPSSTRDGPSGVNSHRVSRWLAHTFVQVPFFFQSLRTITDVASSHSSSLARLVSQQLSLTCYAYAIFEEFQGSKQKFVEFNKGKRMGGGVSGVDSEELNGMK
jgi:hypothetical protein